MTTSVLMSTYHKEKPEYLQMSLESIWTHQTHKPDEIVLVEDGPLTPALYEVIELWKQRLNESLVIVKNERNLGLALSLNKGLEMAKGEIIIRMDSDDVAFPERIAEELAVFEQHADIEVAGSWIAEFVDTPEHVVSVRKVPETNDEIYQFGKKRNPMNHPSVAFRKDCVVKNGGYTHFLLFEDYYMWATLLNRGCKFYNIQKPLLWFRTSFDMFARRGGLGYARTEIAFQYYLYSIGYISLWRMLCNCSVRFIGRLMPNRLRMMAYTRTLRK